MNRKILALEKIQKMSEGQFTLKILIPLYENLGYRVDYNGGSNEGGKDIICWKIGDFGADELTVIQVKKTTASAAAGTSNAFSGIVNQLQQATEKYVPNIKGYTQRPNKVFFITPYEIDTRSLESRFEGMSDLNRRNVHVIDGRMVIETISIKLPSLIDELCGEATLIRSSALAEMSNLDLLSALNYHGEKDIAEFYCDLDFGVGKITTRSFFDMHFTPRTSSFSLDKSRWNFVSEITARLEKVLICNVCIPAIEIVEKNYTNQWDLWASASNQKILSLMSKKYLELENIFEAVLDSCAQAIQEADTVEINLEKKSVKITSPAPKLSTEQESLLYILRGENEALAKKLEGWRSKICGSDVPVDNIEESIRSLDLHFKRMQDFIECIKRPSHLLLNHAENLSLISELFDNLISQYNKRIAEPYYEFTLEGGALVQALLLERSKVENGISCLSKKVWNKNEIRRFFVRCQELYEVVGFILENRILANLIGAQIGNPDLVKSAQRISMPLREVFSTGINCAIYGEAGAGKSTTLYQYASSLAYSNNEKELTLFLPLTKILGGWVDEEKLSPLQMLEIVVVRFLRVPKRNAVNEVLDFLKSKEKLTLIFDGVDEVIKTAPWIIQAISDMEKNYINAQIILSARSSGAYIGAIRYLGLTLLPFSDEQVTEFINGWFKCQIDKANAVFQHLKDTPELYDIVRSPLSATILCVLAEHKVPLPKGELSMYEERMKLLLGHYDIHKKTRRLESHHELLNSAALALAYFLHSKTIRSAPLDTLEEACITALRTEFQGMDELSIRMAVRELIDPCNVLEPMTDDGEFGFGHLRYQEFLCAKQLCANRGIDLQPLLATGWWRSVLVLFSRMTNNLQHIISDIIEKQNDIRIVEANLIAMIETRPRQERSGLLSLVRAHKELDNRSDALVEFHEYDNDNNYLYGSNPLSNWR